MPFETLVKGNWEGHDFELIKDQDLNIFLRIWDKENKGAVITVTIPFVCEGNPERLLKSIVGNVIYIAKRLPIGQFKYLLLLSPPTYVEKENIDVQSLMILKDLDKKVEELRAMASSFGVRLSLLRYQPEKIVAQLLGEPTLLLPMIVGKEKKVVGGRKKKTVILGRRFTGEMVETNIDNFISTIIVGGKEERERAIHILLESCVFGGIIGIIFDDSGRYKNMALPAHEFEGYPLHPMGMPLRSYSLDEMKLDLNVINPASVREILGIKEDVKAWNVLESILASKGITDLDQLKTKLKGIGEETLRFHAFMALRWVEILEQKYGHMIGHIDVDKILPSIEALGSIIRIDTKGFDERIVRAIKYSLLKTVYEYYKQKGEGPNLKLLFFDRDGHKLVPRNPINPTQKALAKLLIECPSYGIGYVLGAPHEIDIHSPIVEKAMTVWEFTGANDVAVKTSYEKPYRMELRPPLSS